MSTAFVVGECVDCLTSLVDRRAWARFPKPYRDVLRAHGFDVRERRSLCPACRDRGHYSPNP